LSEDFFTIQFLARFSRPRRLAAPKIIAVLAGFALLAGCGRSDTKKTEAQASRPVLAAGVHYAPRVEPRAFVAVIRPRVETDQGFRVAGKVVQRFVEVGRQVAAGDLLARLDETDLKLRVEQAEAEAKAAHAALEQAQGDENRGATLRKQGWMAQAIFDRLKTATEEAKGRLLRGERAQELAQNGLDYALLRAEADGIVTAIAVEPGQVVAAGQSAIRLARLGEKEALVAAPEQYLELFRNGRADLASWSDPGKHYAAHLRELSPLADPVARTYAARFSLPEADAALALGMSGTLTIADPKSSPVARLPLTALLNQGHGPAVFVIEDNGRVKLTPVTVGGYDSASVYVSGGVPDGACVVALGVQKLDEGQTVRVLSDLGL
jgi:RND family efflux transporter MFP subunit